MKTKVKERKEFTDKGRPKICERGRGKANPTVASMKINDIHNVIIRIRCNNFDRVAVTRTLASHLIH